MIMRTIPLAAAAALLFTPLAHADKFWLGTETPQEKAVDGNRPDCIEGVVLDQDADTWHLRVAGGELWLQKARVSRVEADGLTVAALEQQEKDAAPRLADAERERERDQAMWQEATASRRAQAAEAAFERGQGQAAAPAQPEPAFDPVLGVGSAQMGDDTLLRDLAVAYRLTNDKRYIKTLRMLRRMR